MIGYSLILPLNKKGRDKEFDIAVRSAVRAEKVPTMAGLVCIVVRIFPRSKRVSAEAWRVAGLIDALQRTGILQGRQIDDIQVTRGAIVPGGRLEVMLGEIDAE